MKLFDIQMKYRGSKQKSWHPSDGKLVSDLNRVWIALEGAEHEREAALRKELMRSVAARLIELGVLHNLVVCFIIVCYF